MESRTIAIIGGGFAGTTLARALDGKLPPGYELLLISEESHTTFTPMLPEVVGAGVFPEQIVAPIRQMVRCARFVMGRVTNIDFAARTIACETLAGARLFSYEHVVLAFGSRARLDMIPGVAEHALPLKTIGDATHLRNLVLRRLARIELETDQLLRQRLGHFIVIGGGSRAWKRPERSPTACATSPLTILECRRREVKVTLLQDIDRLLPNCPRGWQRGAPLARSRARNRGEDQCQVAAVDERDVLLTDGTTLHAATVICTIGTMQNPLVEDSPLFSTAAGSTSKLRTIWVAPVRA